VYFCCIAAGTKLPPGAKKRQKANKANVPKIGQSQLAAKAATTSAAAAAARQAQLRR
jgi:hypothetical protein